MNLNNGDVNTKPIIPNCLKWSEDNQILLFAPIGIYIFTPLYKGINMERNGTCVRNARIECQEFNREREIIQENQETFRCAAWSPSGTSNLKSCLIIAITTKYNVSIYGPKVNPINSDWIEIENMTEQIINSYTSEKVEDITDETVVDQLQSISVSWSPLCIDEYFDPVSIIAIGSKAGTVTFWSYNDGVNFLYCLQAHETWVTTSAWSQWIRLGNEQCKYASSFVTGCVEGSVHLWQVNLSRDFLDNEDARLSISVTLRMVLANEDGRIVDIMKWYDSADGNERFAMIKGRKIYVWISDESMLLYHTQIISLDFTIPMSKIVTGLTWRYDGSQLRVFTMDGIHWTFNISKNEGIYIDEEFSLIEEAKNQEEAENDSSLKEPVYYGADSSANGLFVAVVFALESRTVQYLTDKFEVSHVTFVATENYGNMEMRETLTKQLLNKFEDAFLICRKSITYIMWDLLEYCDPENEYYEDDSFFSILEKAVRNDYLQQSTMPDNLLLSETAYFGSLFNVETNELSLPGLIKRLKSQLYHNTLLNKLRILLHLYNNTLRLEFNGEESIEIQNKVQYEVSTLMKYFLEKVLDTIAYCLQRDLIVNERDQIFILNLCDWVLIYNQTEENLLNYAKIIYECLNGLQGNATRKIFRDLDNEINWTVKIISSKKFSKTRKLKIPARESCPLCQTNILFYC
ncbi:16014_t:CDS:10 [Funneliformis caledonium]|uniref:16014_t:CDS:1 n=1 Tax=Funneliformis caledonium TaxID=1117310 RepID=A0A9N9AX38_9GLOM|nr:16014_t:CDS:10 [Funneliformis caledonium]